MFEKFRTNVSESSVPHKWRSLRDDEPIHANDYVEDLASGQRITIARGPYNFLRGQKAGQARELPQISDVVRVF